MVMIIGSQLFRFFAERKSFDQRVIRRYTGKQKIPGSSFLRIGKEADRQIRQALDSCCLARQLFFVVFGLYPWYNQNIKIWVLWVAFRHMTVPLPEATAFLYDMALLQVPVADGRKGAFDQQCRI